MNKRSGAMALILALALALLCSCGGGGADAQPTGQEEDKQEIGGGNLSTGNTLDERLQPDQSNAEIVIKLAWSPNYDPAHPYTAAATGFNDYLVEQTGGRIVCEYYPSGQLGDDPSCLEQVMLGTLDAQICSTPFTSLFTDVLYGCDMPFLCNGDLSLLYEVQSGEIGRRLLDAAQEDLGVQCLAFTYQPFRHFFTNKEISSMEDYANMKMRAMDSPVHLDTFRAMGMNPVVVGFTEVFTMMQQGGIDGWDSDIIGIVTGGFYEVATYCTLSGHFNNSVMINMSDSLFDSLSPEDQALVREAAVHAGEKSYQVSLEQDEKRFQEAQELGIIVNEIDMEPLMEAVQPVIDKYCAEVPACKEFVDAVEALKAERGI